MKGFILCIDDEKIILDTLRSQLKDFLGNGFIIESAESGDEALEILQEYEEDRNMFPSLVISDMIMPNMKGSELLREIHSKYPKTKKILLTGQASSVDIIDTISKVRLYRYFPKPWDTMDLNLTVKEAITAYENAEILASQRDELLELNEELEEKVELRTEQLSLKNKTIMDSIYYAKRIQDGVLIDLEEVKAFLPDFFVYYKPLHVVSGDSYFFAKVYKKVVAIALDCTGHGVPGALMSMIANSLLNRIVNVQKVTDPATILEEFHLGVVKALNQEQTGIEDGVDCVVCVYDEDLMQLMFAGAKRPLVYIQDGEMKYIKGDSLPIGGLVEYERKYTNHIVNINKTTTCYMFSDGFVDQFGGENNTRFKINTFRNLIMKNSHQDLDKQKGEIEKAMIDWQGDTPQTDDMLVIGFKLEP